MFRMYARRRPLGVDIVIRSTCIATFVLVGYGLVGSVRAGDATVPGEVTTPYPTLINLGVEWHIEGDDNENGRVAVRYRAVGESDWRVILSPSLPFVDLCQAVLEHYKARLRGLR